MKLIWGVSFFAGLAVFVTAVAALATPGTNVSTPLLRERWSRSTST